MVNLTVVVQDICDVYSENEADSSRSESLEKQVSVTKSAEKIALLMFLFRTSRKPLRAESLCVKFTVTTKNIYIFDANVFRQLTFL